MIDWSSRREECTRFSGTSQLCCSGSESTEANSVSSLHSSLTVNGLSSSQSESHKSGVIKMPVDCSLRSIEVPGEVALFGPGVVQLRTPNELASAQKILILYWLRHLSVQNCNWRWPSCRSTYVTVCRTCLHQSQTFARLKAARRHCEKQISEQKIFAGPDPSTWPRTPPSPISLCPHQEQFPSG